MKRIRHVLEALGLTLGMALLRLLSPEAASNLGGFICRTLGPRIPVSERARRNLRLAMPELSEARIAEIVYAMWDNLGRVFAEYPHLGRISDPNSGRVVLENVEPAFRLRDSGGPGVLCSAHLANWEIMPVVAARNGFDLTSIVRQPNNPLVRSGVERMRGVAGGQWAPKGQAAARQAIKVLRGGKLLAMLFDQKFNSGLSVPFFGIDAMTVAAPAQLALRFRCPLVLIRIERTGPARFRLSAHEPLALPDSGDRQHDVEQVTRQMNAILEDWIRARPEQWLWLHRRWPDEAYRKAELQGRRN